jgi:ABC-type multidrug transport system fused ATPase/permease subunit
VALAYLALAGLQFLAGRVETLVVAEIGQQMLYKIRTTLFAHLQRLSLDFYERERTGGVVARMTSDVEAAGDLVADGLVTLITSVVTMGAIAVILVALAWRLALEIFVVAPFLLLAAAWFRRRSSAAWRQVREAATTVSVRLQEALSAIRVIQAFRHELATADLLAAANQDERGAVKGTITLDALFFPGVEFGGAVATVVALASGGPAVLAGHLQIGTLTAFLLYLRTLFSPIYDLSELYDTLQSATAGAERIHAVLNLEPTVREAPVPIRPSGPGGLIRGSVRVEGVHFAYPGPDDTTGPPVLRGVDLTVPAGSTLALVGRTGAGKSTIAKLMLRFYDPQAGRVTFGGVDLRSLALADLREAVAYVPQDGFLFSGTIQDNIRFGRPDATRREIAAAVRAVGASQLIEDLPRGLDSEVGERGIRLAAGERQLIAIARAWIADPALLILDEATSSLDATIEVQVHRALRRLRQGRTTLVIAHRLSTVIDADQVVIVEGGQVVESGSPAELLRIGGRFAALHDQWLAAAAP